MINFARCFLKTKKNLRQGQESMKNSWEIYLDCENGKNCLLMLLEGFVGFEFECEMSRKSR